MTTTYSATAAREGKWWLVRVPELDGLTQARRLSEVELMAREWIAVTLDVALDSVAVDVAVDSVGNVAVAERLETIRRERREAAELERRASEESVKLAKDLADEQIPVRDIGAILGVSFQRAHQLINP